MDRLLELRQQLIDGVNAYDPTALAVMVGIVLVVGVVSGVVQGYLSRH